MLVLVGLAIADIVRNLLDVYLTQRFIIRWRVWLTNRLTGDWLDGDAYYRGQVRRRADRQPGPAHPAGHRHLHHQHRPRDQHADRRDVADAVVRHRVRDLQRGVLHPDPVGPGGPAHGLRRHRAEGAVLDGARLRVLHDDRRVLDRAPPDPAVVRQRDDQRRVPLCAGAASRRGRGRRPVQGSGRRTRRADDQIRRRSSPTIGHSCAGRWCSSAGTGR